MIIDARCRPPVPEVTAFFKSNFCLKAIKPRLYVNDFPPSFKQESMELFWSEFHEAGITQAVMAWRDLPNVKGVAMGNDRVKALVDEHPDKLLGIANIYAHAETEAALKEIKRAVGELELRGVTLDPGMVTPPLHFDDQKLYPVYKLCMELDVPVFVHTSPLIGGAIDWTHPKSFENIAQQLPHLRIVAVHGCWPYVIETIAVANRYKNFYILPDIALFLPQGDLYLEAANFAATDQILFGSAYPVMPMKTAVDRFGSFELKYKDKVMYQNAQALLKL